MRVGLGIVGKAAGEVGGSASITIPGVADSVGAFCCLDLFVIEIENGNTSKKVENNKSNTKINTRTTELNTS